MTEPTATPEGCRYLALERVNAEEDIERITELLTIAERKGDEVRIRVFTEKLDEKRQRLAAVTETYRALDCRRVMDDERERAEAGSGR